MSAIANEADQPTLSVFTDRLAGLDRDSPDRRTLGRLRHALRERQDGRANHPRTCEGRRPAPARRAHARSQPRWRHDGDFDIANPGADNTCTNEVLDADETCTVQVDFVGTGAANQRQTDLVVSSDNAADGEAVAALTGTVPE